AHIEFLYRLFAEAGFRDSQVPWFASMIKNFIYSYVEEENRLLTRAERNTDGESYAERIQSLPAAQFPHFIRLAKYTTAVNWDEEFMFGLTVLMDGFEAQRS